MKFDINNDQDLLRCYVSRRIPSDFPPIIVTSSLHVRHILNGEHEVPVRVYGPDTAFLAIADPGGNGRMTDFILATREQKRSVLGCKTRIHQLAFSLAGDAAYIPELLYGTWQKRPFYAYNSPDGWTVILLLSDYVSVQGYDVLSKCIADRIPSMVPISPTAVIKAPTDYEGYRYAINVGGRPLIAGNLLNWNQTQIIKSRKWAYGDAKEGVNRGTCWF